MQSDPRRIATDLAGRWRRLLRSARLLLAPAWFSVALVVGWLWLDPFGPPDIGDPFDVAVFGTVAIPEEENAVVLYRRAAAVLPPHGRCTGPHWARLDSESPPGDREWSKADPAFRAFVADLRPFLDLWRLGTERPAAVDIQPKDYTYYTTSFLNFDNQSFFELAMLEGSRLEAAGDLDGAWVWYRAVLRCGRHMAMHGDFRLRLRSTWVHGKACPRVVRWAADPRVGAPALRRALRDVVAIDALTPPDSYPLKVHYLETMKELDAPKSLIDSALSGERPPWYARLPIRRGWVQSIRRAEVERQVGRSRRVFRIVFANWLAHFDASPRLRSGRVRDNPSLYAPPVPATSAGPRPEDIVRWLDSTPIASELLLRLDYYEGRLAQERRDQARMVVSLASELFRREHGRPPGTLRELIGPDLPSLPDGYDLNGAVEVKDSTPKAAPARRPGGKPRAKAK